MISRNYVVEKFAHGCGKIIQEIVKIIRTHRKILHSRGLIESKKVPRVERRTASS